MQLHHYLGVFVGVAALGIAMTLAMLSRLFAFKNTDQRSAAIALLIRKGAMTFLRKEYSILAVVVALVSGVLFYVFPTAWYAGAFLTGSLSSMLAGYVGMRASTMANELTVLRARSGGERPAFFTALLGGSVMGFVVASLGLLGLGVLFYLFIDVARAQFETILVCYGFGASTIALFARVGGGIFTKAADVGADLVGKIEMGIPEDDPRNPAVIADCVGDNVGDTAGMGADIFESYIGAAIGAIILASTSTVYGDNLAYLALPIMLCAIGLVTSLIGLASVFIIPARISLLLKGSTVVAIAAFIAASYGYLVFMGLDLVLFGSIFLGAFSGVIIGEVTDYYTSGVPIRKLADASRSGAGTNVIYGLSIGFESVVIPVCSIAIIAYISCQYFGGVFGVALAAVSMLATVAITMTVDAYGPIADNAGGIAEMAGFGPNVRQITDKLDMLGNMTAALGKGFAIGSAVFASLALFHCYCQAAKLSYLNLLDPVVITGLFIGGSMPFMLSAMTMRSVGRAAWKMVMEVRRQFKEIPGLMQGTAQPDYERCINISTQAALVEMLLPGALTIIIPVAIKFGFGAQGSLALGGFLAGATLTSVVLALTMANAGGAWDNAKKYIEAGNLGGKGSDAHRAAVVGDTVGDPFKDTSGPSLNILIKLMSMLSLLLAAL